MPHSDFLAWLSSAILMNSWYDYIYDVLKDEDDLKKPLKNEDNLKNEETSKMKTT